MSFVHLQIGMLGTTSPLASISRKSSFFVTLTSWKDPSTWTFSRTLAALHTKPVKPPLALPKLITRKPRWFLLWFCAIDQDLYFRVARDVAPRLHYHSRQILPGAPSSRFKDELFRWRKCNHHDGYHGTDVRLSFTSPVQASTCLHYSTVERARSTSTPSLAVGTPPKNIAALAEILVYKYLNFSTDDDSELSAIREGYPALSSRRAHWRRDALWSCKPLWRTSRRDGPLSPIVFLTTTGRWFGAARRGPM